MSKKNFLNLVNTHTPANTASTALTGKESKMKQILTLVGKFIEAQTFLVWFYMFPAAVINAGCTLLTPGQTACMLAIAAVSQILIMAFAAVMEKGLQGAFALNAVLFGGLTGAAMFRCMCEGLQAETWGYASIAGGVVCVLGATMALLGYGALLEELENRA